jgi:hypothetical protein
MRHPLLVTPLIDPHFTAVLFKRLAHSQHVAVAKDSKDAFDELMLFAIDFQVLVIRNFTSACAIVSLSLPMLPNPYCSVFAG